MSTTVVVPPPSSSSLVRRLPRLTSRARALLTAVNLHYAAVAALLVIVLYMAGHLILTSQELHARNADAFAQQRSRLSIAELQARPLRGLDTKLTASTEGANDFYTDRLPAAASQVAAELGVLTQHAGVHQNSVQYGYSPVLSGPDALTEMRMDASIAGDYRPIVEFINSLERDRMFFLIIGINLTGQQSGQVNLRIRMLTYLRTPYGVEVTTGLPAGVGPADQATSAAGNGTTAGTGEGAPTR